MLPRSLDSERLQQIAIALLVALGVASILVIRFVQKVTTKVIALLLIAAVGVGLWAQREELHRCSATCNCQLFGQDVHVPKVGCDRQLQS